MEAVECGAASLAIVLGFHGKILPLEAVRLACDVSRDGTKATNIAAAARSYGLKAKGFRKSPEAVQEMEFPVIIHWNFNHFLVLEGFHKGRAYLSDPASGRYSVPFEEFDESFTGVVLAFERSDEFEPGREKPGFFQSLLPRLSGSEKDLAFVVLASLGLIIPGLVIPTFTQVFVDGFLVQRLHDWVVPLLILMTLVMGLNSALTWVQQRYLLRLETKLSLATSSNFLWHVLHLPAEFFTQRSGGEISSRVQLNDKVARLLSGELATNILNLVTVVFYLALMLLYDPFLTFIVFAIANINGVVLWKVSRGRSDASRRLAQEMGKLTGTTMGGLAGIESLKASGGDDEFYSKWSGHLVKSINAQQDLGLRTRSVAVIPPFLTSMSTAAILSIGALRVMQGDLTLGMLIAFKFLADNFLQPVNRLVNLGVQLQEATADMARLDDVLRYHRDPYVAPPPEPATSAAKLSGELELRNVTFGYARLSPPVIRDFSLHLRPGMRVALVGSSGSGKSTIAKLVCGLYEPSDGVVLFDGLRREEIPRDTLTGSLALVDQEILLFRDTVRANIALWDTTLPDPQIVAAARDACIHAEVSARRGGYDSLVAEAGANFSGGQRQRVEIARALAQNPSILVLDEATSALDPTTEKEVMDNLRRRGCTCLIVAHRLSTIRDCDEIIVLRHGQVVERGTHEEMAHAGGYYAELIRAG